MHHILSAYKTMRAGSSCSMRRVSNPMSTTDSLRRCCYNKKKQRWDCLELGYDRDGKPNRITATESKGDRNPVWKE